MRKHQSIPIGFWQDPFLLQLTAEEKLMYVYLLTNLWATQCGVFQLPTQIIALETGFNADTVVLVCYPVTATGVLYTQTKQFPKSHELAGVF